jgi:hypothetical protein
MSTPHGDDGRLRCCLDAGHAGEHLDPYGHEHARWSLHHEDAQQAQIDELRARIDRVVAMFAPAHTPELGAEERRRLAGFPAASTCPICVALATLRGL